MKAIVLCAGYGTRLGDLTRKTPKPMLPIRGKPLLAYTLQYLASYGFKQIAINLHFLPEQIRGYFGNGSQFGVEIYYSYEPQLLGTAGAVKKLESWLGDMEDFLVVYGDILTDQDLSILWEKHQREKALATLLLHQREGSNSLVQMDSQNRVTAFIERPTEEQRKASPFPWVNSGIYVLHRRILDHIPSNQTVDFPKDIFSRVVTQERLYGVPLTGYRCAIDSPGRYMQAQMAVHQGRYDPLKRIRIRER